MNSEFAAKLLKMSEVEFLAYYDEWSAAADSKPE